MALSFGQMLAEAKANVPGISSAEAQKRIKADPNVLVIDVQDAADVGACGLVPGGVNISLGMLPIRADLELPEHFRDPKLQDRSRPIITTCGAGGQAALAAFLLKRMGFSNVAYIDGGMKAWTAAGLPTQKA